ncbi:hypothetical protein JDBV08_00730 [Mycobacterium phage jiawei]|uniref:hypothetical protein n=1 Tax=Brevundimonas diminuta TaxID=293 RepID=UPI001904A365|nr:hypothetical protein [Brevundimonas diminuta]MBK1968430.1 hypothetical protein [Brevundimonas diminuta]WRQ08313.1 hypothetical protein JDBV08_00730 [Mycobacterium phage jiawei]
MPRLTVRPERLQHWHGAVSEPCQPHEADLWAVYRGDPADLDLVAEFEDRDDAWAFVERRRATRDTLPLPFAA